MGASLTYRVLLLLTLALHVSSGLPARTLSDCAPLFQKLLHHVQELLKSDQFCHAIPAQIVTRWSQTEANQACVPPVRQQNPGCLHHSNSFFNERECLSNIRKDLDHFEAAIRSYLKTDLRCPQEEAQLLEPLLDIKHNLTKECPMMPVEESDSSEQTPAQMFDRESYVNRLKICALMRGFHVRVITINRAIHYMSSGNQRE